MQFSIPVLVLILLPSALAGCFGAADDDILDLPNVIQAVYRAPSGEELHVETAGFGPVRNATGATVTSFRIQYAFGLPPNGSPLIPFTTEHVDPETGMIIRQDRHCVPRGSLSDTPCYEGRFAITYKAAGLPGGLGMGPVWFSDQSYYDQRALVIDTVQAGPREYRIHREGIAGCTQLNIEAADDAPYLRSWSTPTVLEGPWRACTPFLLPKSFRPTHALPASASSTENITFELVDYTQGAGQLRIPDLAEPFGDCRTTWLGATDSNTPLSNTDASRLTSMEAHLKARELDSGYANITENRPMHVVYARYAPGGGFQSNFPDLIANAKEYQWYFDVSNGEQARRVELEKRYTDATLTEAAKVEYKVESAEDLDPAEVDVPLDDKQRRLTIGTVGRFLEPFDNVELMNVEMGRHTAGDWLPDGAPRDQDYVVTVFFRKVPAEEGDALGGGPGMVVPLWISMDSTRPAVTAMTIDAVDRDLVETMDWCPS